MVNDLVHHDNIKPLTQNQSNDVHSGGKLWPWSVRKYSRQIVAYSWTMNDKFRIFLKRAYMFTAQGLTGDKTLPMPWRSKLFSSVSSVWTGQTYAADALISFSMGNNGEGRWDGRYFGTQHMWASICVYTHVGESKNGLRDHHHTIKLITTERNT